MSCSPHATTRRRLYLSIACAAALLLAGAPGPAGANGDGPSGTGDLRLPTVTDPSYHRVVGVAEGGVLDIRSGPSASAPIIGGLAPDAQPIEVIDTHDGWGLVIAGEGNGWVSMASLEPVTPDLVGSSATPVGAVCAGNEPFWSLTLSSGSAATFDPADGAAISLGVDAAGRVGGRPNMDFIWMSGGGQTASAFISREICSDGMSDRLYGQRIGLTLRSSGGTAGYDGCCFVPPPGP